METQRKATKAAPNTEYKGTENIVSVQVFNENFVSMANVKSLGKMMRDLTHAPIEDARSGEINIVAALAARKETYNEK